MSPLWGDWGREGAGPRSRVEERSAAHGPRRPPRDELDLGVAGDQLLHMHRPVVLLDATIQQGEDSAHEEKEERQIPPSVLQAGGETDELVLMMRGRGRNGRVETFPPYCCYSQR